MVMEPKAKSRANFCGAMTMTGKKEKDSAQLIGAWEENPGIQYPKLCAK